MANNGQPGFLTQKTKLIQQYDQSGASYEATTKPYKSTCQLVFTVVDAEPGTPTMASAIARSGQILNFFGYKLGDSIPFGGVSASATRTAIESDTNLSVARHTNGVEDFCITGVSMTARSARVAYSGTYSGSDPDATNANSGQCVIYDPAALVAPPQVGSPYNLENALMSAIAPHLAIEFEWDRKKKIPIGTADELPEGGAKSFLKANGDPRNDNQYKVPEGFVWRHEGVADSEFIVRGSLVESVVVPISLIQPWGGSVTQTPKYLFLDLTVRLHGLALSLPSQN